MKSSTKNDAEGKMHQAKGKVKEVGGNDKTETKIEFYKRIQAFRRAKRMQKEIAF